MTPTVSRRDIRLEEEREWLHYGVGDPTGEETTQWTATLDGPLSTGERVEMSRGGATSAEALAALEGAIVENGWRVA